jgi:hypothetical protein
VTSLDRDEWVTRQQALDQFGITRQTFWNWRNRYPIRETQPHPRLRLYNLHDLTEADEAATRRNPTMRNVI